MKYPKNIDEAKEVCSELCSNFGVEISFDDKWCNFGSERDRCICAGNSIQCSMFRAYSFELMPFAVMHELGHIRANENYIRNKNNFSREFDAWQFAIGLFVTTFNRNIGIKHARFMLNCLNSYVPDYNDISVSKYGIKEMEGGLWCPIKKRIFK